MHTFATLSLASCTSGPCSGQASRCDGNQLYFCDTNRGDLSLDKWEKDQLCSVACQDFHDGSAACVDASAPIPECATDGMTCWNGRQTTCKDGFPENTADCEAGTACVAVPGCSAVCTAASPDPRCPANVWDVAPSLCADNAPASCHCGFLFPKAACSDHCELASDGAMCTIGAARDPLCGDPARPTSGYCTDTQAVTCSFGFDVEIATCNPSPTTGPVCDVSFGIASCGEDT